MVKTHIKTPGTKMAFAAARMIIHKEAKGNRKKSLDDANLKGDMKVTSIHIVQTVK